MRSFIDYLHDLEVYDAEDLGLFILNGLFVLGILFWIITMVGFVLVKMGISFLFAPIIVISILISSFFVSVLIVNISNKLNGF